MSDLHVGGEVEAYCGSCKAVRWHVVVALVGDRPVKVECQSCHKQHGFRTSATTSSARSSTGASVKKRAPVNAEPIFDVSALQARSHEARAYAPAQTFKVGDVLRHPTFGLGLVQGVPAAQKIDVRFPSGSKLLVHAKS